MRYCHQLVPGVYPTPIYETVLSLVGFGILFALRSRIRIAGMLFFYVHGLQRCGKVLYRTNTRQ